jgi:hypothetical protein
MKMINVIVAFVSASLIVTLLTACSVFQPTPAPTPMPTQTLQPLPTTGVQYYFVASKLQIPTTQEQTQTFAFNVDGDAQNSLDNKLGNLFALLTTTAQGVELQSTLDQAVNAGQVVSLHVVKANDPLNDTSVSWSIFLGQKAQSAPKFDGSDHFKIDSTVPVNPPIIGSLTDGHFTGGPGNLRTQLFLLGQNIYVDLTGVRLEADLSADGCSNGKLGGGLSVEEFRGKILPAITEGLNQAIRADKNAENTFLPLFDSDSNGIITIQEFENNPLFMIAVSPDLDLLDASGKFNPGQDGVKDSYSIGMGFSCVVASFTAPED